LHAAVKPHGAVQHVSERRRSIYDTTMHDARLVFSIGMKLMLPVVMTDQALLQRQPILTAESEVFDPRLTE
jgi:hypothetical protein